jgi:hypothetical protein
MRAPTSITLLALALSAQGCFFDSRWFEQRHAEKTALEHARPAELKATPAVETEIPAARAERVLRVRAHASARYAAEVVDWPRQLAQTLEAAGEVLGPTLGVRLSLVGTAPWATRGGEEDPGARLDELVMLDDGKDVDWVIGLLGSVPRAELSFHQLGMARLPGKHLVMRAMNDVREMEGIEHGFPLLGAAERRELYRSRKRHKTTACLLHELGHTLGVPHEVDAVSLMGKRYDPKVSSYSDAAAALMRLSLARKDDPAAQPEAAFAAAFAAEVRRTAEVWIAEDREDLLRRLALAAPPPPRPGRTARPVGNDEPTPAADEGLGAMSILDRNSYQHALAEKAAGRMREANEAAKGLYASYPDVLAVQDLRCQLAMSAGGAWQDVQAACARFMELSRMPARKR